VRRDISCWRHGTCRQPLPHNPNDPVGSRLSGSSFVPTSLQRYIEYGEYSEYSELRFHGRQRQLGQLRFHGWQRQLGQLRNLFRQRRQDQCGAVQGQQRCRRQSTWRRFFISGLARQPSSL
jgi:hypothetical protein